MEFSNSIDHIVDIMIAVGGIKVGYMEPSIDEMYTLPLVVCRRAHV